MTLDEIRNKMKQCGLGAYVISHGNRFIGQDILPSEHKIKNVCGFSGSAGILAVTSDNAYLLVDGRYELQARRQVNVNEITVVDKMPRFKNVCDLLQEKGISDIGYDAWCHPIVEMEFLKRRYRDIRFVDAGDWLHSDSVGPVTAMRRDVQFAGKSREEKCKLVADMLLEKQSDYYLFTSADSVSWLLNLYARDLPCSPVVRAYALISLKGDVILFSDRLQADLPVKPWNKLADTLSGLKDAKILYDGHTTPEKIKLLLSDEVSFNKAPDICQELKAIKNDVELQGMINCHIRDGVALVNLFCWLEKQPHGLTELDIVKKLHALRAEQEYFFSESFETIAAAGENGAIVHYQPTHETNTLLPENGLLLLDSGGQYLDGTTDVTRTIALGTPTTEMIKDFTTVLKAHIALAQVRFPVGTAGIKLDVIARANLWQNGEDYKHGTGHGVACFGNVHEGPISISVGSSEYGFRSNMVCSNEPGVYKEGKYGIRIENLQYTTIVKDVESAEFLKFCYLTKVPIDKKLIDKYMLGAGEREWLNSYHQDVYNTLTPYLSSEAKLWLEKACSPL
ncbi:MAG: aminopeptidase P family protein [Alphaproteobacteria bacterium]|nr:aminopeptidase P family protein [Alphaproteobacteria bacterium]